MRKIAAVLTAIAALLTALCLCGCDGTDIDESAAKAVIGEYNVVENTVDGDSVGGWWHLSIQYDDDDRLYLSIYDHEAGNPGVEGGVVSLDGEQITIKYDPDYFEELPSGKWKTDGENLVMNYELKDGRIILTNNERGVQFIKEPDVYTICGRWKMPDHDELADVVIGADGITLKGWQYNTLTEEWTEEEKTYAYADDCIYSDFCIDFEVIPQKDFAELMQRDEAKELVLELDMIGEEVSEVRLTTPDSCYIPN